MDLIIDLAKSPEFEALTPVSQAHIDKREREELVTRFFAYLEGFDPDAADGAGDIPTYKESPRTFFFRFVRDQNEQIREEAEQHGNSKTLEEMRDEFYEMLSFVQKISPNGFTKSQTGSQVPRVRFEAIAVGTALALRAKPEIVDAPKGITSFLESTEFLSATKSDAANVKSKLLGRIRLVRDWLVSND